MGTLDPDDVVCGTVLYRVDEVQVDYHSGTKDRACYSDEGYLVVARNSHIGEELKVSETMIQQNLSGLGNWERLTAGEELCGAQVAEKGGDQ